MSIPPYPGIPVQILAWGMGGPVPPHRWGHMGAFAYKNLNFDP